MRKDDFQPFADDQDAYWTGFFTTRPILKRFDRVVGSHFHSSLRLQSMMMLNKKSESDDHSKVKDTQYNALDNLGILQHHDAITGTCHSNVYRDYMARLSHSLNLIKWLN
jgi:hypothetical protein